jgi:hypothetical protein
MRPTILSEEISTMTTATMALTELAEKGATSTCCARWCSSWPRPDGARHRGALRRRLRREEPERINSRNGYRDRTWDRRAGSVELKFPKLRQGSYFPEFLKPRRTAEKALTAVIQEAYVHGVSTRSVDGPVEAVGMSGVSKSPVRRVSELDERVGAFLNRQIEGQGSLPASQVRASGRHVTSCRTKKQVGRKCRKKTDGADQFCPQQRMSSLERRVRLGIGPRWVGNSTSDDRTAKTYRLHRRSIGFATP